MTDPLELLLSRRSIRRYTGQPIPPEIIDRLLTAATQAPSAHNRQPWRFVVMTDGATRARLAAAMGAQLRHDLAADGLPAEAIARDA
ncbi:MAG: nitroreductase family protein, partial [Candidatus Promineofilum sp.]|nr:nitroreductase family protein [Promineifilum sp.]